MKKLLFTISSLFFTLTAMAVQRFPKPEFESGYKYPDLHYALPHEMVWEVVDIVLLVVLMSVVAWAMMKKRNRKPIVWVSIISIAYFGFFRKGCVCSIGSIQNVVLAFVDPTYVLPLSVLAFFILPIIFAFFFGRVFCAGVCPFGALQDIVNVKNYRLSKAVSTVLGIIPWIYLAFGILFAATKSLFIICRFDPFIGIYRLGGAVGFVTAGALLLLAAVFTGRPFCRFLCPYGALLSLFSRVSIWKSRLTTKECISCDLCHNSCPVDAVRPPYNNEVKESRSQGVKRMLGYFVGLPILIIAGALLMRMSSGSISRVNKDVKLYDMVMAQEANPQENLNLDLEAFYGQGRTVAALKASYEKHQADFKLYSTIVGGFIGLVIGLALINLSVRRKRLHYEINPANCVSCGRCFSYCPQNNDKIILENKNHEKSHS